MVRFNPATSTANHPGPSTEGMETNFHDNDAESLS